MDKNRCSAEEIIGILEKFESQIQKQLNQTLYQEREDLAQEIRLKIIEKLNSLELSETLSFWSFIEKREGYPQR